MAKKKPKKKKRYIWHSYFDAAHVLATAIAVIFSFGEVMSGAGIIMLASIAASAFVLTYKYRHHLTTLGTITLAYVIAGVMSIGIVMLLRLTGVAIIWQAFVLLFGVSALLLLLNTFHPPAVAFGMAFIIFTRNTSEYVFVLFATLMILIAIRLIIYIVHEHLDINDFFQEFLREEKFLVEEEELIIKKAVRRA
jgi:hypothetical protein